MKRPQQPVLDSLAEKPEFSPGELVVFAKPGHTPCWTDELTPNGEWRESPLYIWEDTPAIVLRCRITDDDHVGGEVNPYESELECFYLYDLLVNGEISSGWQQEAIRKI